MDPKVPSQKKKYHNSMTIIRIAKPTSRIIQSLVKKTNSKKYGRSVRSDDIIKKAISLLKDSHLEEIKELTYSSKDRLEIQHKKYCETHGYISKDEFLQLLLSKALPEISKTNQQVKS